MNTNHPRPAGLPPVDSLDLQLGLDTFGDMTVAPDGTALSSAQVVRNVLAQAQAADRSGVDVFGIGEHHRDDYAVSAPDVVLAAAASTTERIRLGTSVTVLSSDDPVRVFERFSTLDAVSRGRAEVTLGRGSFTESFPLFGYDLADYDQLFAEKLDLFTKLLPERPVAWEGQLRPSLRTPGLMPRTEHGLRAWTAVGGGPPNPWCAPPTTGFR